MTPQQPQTVYEEIQKEVERIITLSEKDRERDGHLDFKSLEQRIRTSMQAVGSVMLEGLLNADGGGYQGRKISDNNGREYEFVGYLNNRWEDLWADRSCA